jgi:hypothetical protein
MIGTAGMSKQPLTLVVENKGDSTKNHNNIPLTTASGAVNYAFTGYYATTGTKATPAAGLAGYTFTIKLSATDLQSGIDAGKSKTFTGEFITYAMPHRGIVGITWTLILDPGRRTLDFASLDCTAWILSRLQAMGWWRSHWLESIGQAISHTRATVLPIVLLHIDVYKVPLAEAHSRLYYVTCQVEPDVSIVEGS